MTLGEPNLFIVARNLSVCSVADLRAEFASDIECRSALINLSTWIATGDDSIAPTRVSRDFAWGQTSW